MIANELMKKYTGFESMANAKEKNGNTDYTELIVYQLFLKNTDYLAMKLAEGEIVKSDYTEEFNARKFARAEINRLQTEVM